VSDRPDVLIVGAGVSGLTTGVRLVESGLRVRIRAVRRPRDTCSAAAGAIWDPIYATHPHMVAWATKSYEVFADMAAHGAPGVHVVDGIEASRQPIVIPSWATRLPGYRECAAAELPDGFVRGWFYQAPIIDMPSYLDTLLDRLASHGVEIGYGAALETLDEAFDEAGVVVNCTGVGARELVPDAEVTPVRGQLVAVVNPGIHTFFAEHTDELGEMTYVIPQGDVLLLGGSAEKGETAEDPDPVVAQGIVARSSAIFPRIADAPFLGHRIGIRPGRGIIRVEHEDLGDRHLVHNYGHGGAGVSVSWGCADEVTEIVLGTR